MFSGCCTEDPHTLSGKVTSSPTSSSQKTYKITNQFGVCGGLTLPGKKKNIDNPLVEKAQKAETNIKISFRPSLTPLFDLSRKIMRKLSPRFLRDTEKRENSRNLGLLTEV